MYLFITVLHIVLSVFLIGVILLQPGKGGDVGSAFGGGGMGGGNMFGARGPASLLSRATTLVAIMFMCTSITLSMYSSKELLEGASVEDELMRLQAETQPKEDGPVSTSEEPLKEIE